jgi:hypothetical protein
MIDVSKVPYPVFRDRSELSFEELNDPDYALKELEKINGGHYIIACSKCHHCR